MGKAGIILSWIGFAFGLGLAFYNKKGFWTYVGYAFLFSIIGSALGYAIDAATSKPITEEKPAEAPTV